MRKASANGLWQEGVWLIVGGGRRLEGRQAVERCCVQQVMIKDLSFYPKSQEMPWKYFTLDCDIISFAF